MKRILLYLATLLLAPTAAAQVGSEYCFGNSCPCGNDDPSAGCGNLGADGDVGTGSTLTGTGSADVWMDDLVLTVEGIQPGQFGLVFLGDTVSPVATGDGLRCVGAGSSGLWRFPIAQAGSNGAFTLEGVVAQSQAFGGSGWIDAGETWSFQAWARDPGGPCGSGSNFTNALAVTFEPPGASLPIPADFAGRTLAAYPFFERTRSSNQGEDLFAALDSTRFPWLVGVTGDLYVVEARDADTWQVATDLVDVRAGGAQSWSIAAGGVQPNTLLIDAGGLNGTTGTQVGVGYDVVFDADQDGQLGPGDVIDGLSDQAGVYVVRDTAEPGPHVTTEVLHGGGPWLNQNIYYPSDIATLGELPLLVVSHGNGHNYTWYDHIGEHMASYGWVVMSHQNNTVPGIETASETTLTNTDHFLGNLSTIAGGVLEGHVDSGTIAWIGHSRGGEGITRAYDRLFDGDYLPANYSIDDIAVLSSIAPTVFLNKGASHPHKVDYHLWVGSADSDVSGSPMSQVTQPFILLERANGEKACVVLQGAGHGVFHDGGGNWWANGPCQIGPVRVHRFMRGYMLPMLSYFALDDPASRDFLWRQYETFQPIGAPANNDGCVVVNLEYHAKGTGRWVIDDFESEPSPDVSSSGQPVTYTVTDLTEGRLKDTDSTFNWSPGDPLNGMTRSYQANEQPMGLVFSFEQPSYLEFSIDPARQNWSDDEILSFRACQGTRHPNTAALLGDLDFLVTLRDVNGATSSIRIGAYGGGIEEPYQRVGGFSDGQGWANEFETIRLRLTDFLADGPSLNLALIEAVRFEFGMPGSELGRLGLDSLELHERE
jgi:hypothetical protein